MAAAKDTSIRLKETTRFRLDNLKGSKTHDTFLGEMLTYFETTGIMPQSMMISPVVAVKEHANRVIEVVRGIEKTQKPTLKAILDAVSQLAAQQKNGSLPAGANPDEYMHVNEVQKLLAEAERLRNENAHKDEELARMRTQLEIAGKKTPVADTTGGTVNVPAIKKTLLETVAVFDERKKPSTFNDDIYEFDRNTFDKWIARFRSDLNKL